MRQWQSKIGFTLLELLVVLAVIAVLAGLTFTGLQQAIAARERMRCLNSLRQWTIALELYASEHGGTYPPSGELFNRTPEIGAFMTNFLQVTDSGTYAPHRLALAMCNSGIAKFSDSTAYVGWNLFAGYQGPTPLENDYAGVDFSNERTAKDSGMAFIACLTAGTNTVSWAGHSIGAQSPSGPAGQMAAWPAGHAKWVQFDELGVAVTKNVPFVGLVPYYMPRKGI
jgi:prepilin-type N-terminal cleavage/methylation domain-containing protein